MVVNFFGMEDIINSLDGVDVNINSNEISYLNACVEEINKINSSGKAVLYQIFRYAAPERQAGSGLYEDKESRSRRI